MTSTVLGIGALPNSGSQRLAFEDENQNPAAIVWEYRNTEPTQPQPPRGYLGSPSFFYYVAIPAQVLRF
jgi:hypothetical protein